MQYTEAQVFEVIGRLYMENVALRSSLAQITAAQSEQTKETDDINSTPA